MALVLICLSNFVILTLLDKVYIIQKDMIFWFLYFAYSSISHLASFWRLWRLIGSFILCILINVWQLIMIIVCWWDRFVKTCQIETYLYHCKNKQSHLLSFSLKLLSSSEKCKIYRSNRISGMKMRNIIV